MKKLLAAGETRIFAFARVFRNRERDALHAPEFTMLEWYRVGEGLEALMRDCAALLRLAAEAAGDDGGCSFRGREADPFAEPERLSVREAFSAVRRAGHSAAAGRWPGQARPSDGGRPDRDRLAARRRALGLRIAADDTWSDMFSRVLSEKVEPNLGLGRPTFLADYPATEAALAGLSPRDPRVADRFELYACGVELANAFGELTDPAEQRRRFEEDMALKAQIYGESYPLDEDFLALPALHAGGERRGARIRPAGDARLRRRRLSRTCNGRRFSGHDPDDRPTPARRCTGCSASPTFAPARRRSSRAVLSGEDVLAVMPTGSGKSLLFQLPALLGDGLTVVVSPLIALMRDQVAQLARARRRGGGAQFGLRRRRAAGDLRRARRGARCGCSMSRPSG